MRFGAAQRAIGICNRLKAGKPGHAERLKFRLHFCATVRAMVQVDVVNVTALKPGWAMGVRDRWQLRFACPTLSKKFVLCPAAKTITQIPILFSQDWRNLL